jgi:transcriptional regulator with XRE-family HTH domain
MTSIYTKTEQIYLQKVGLKIKKLRLQKALSQERFAQTCQLDRTYISDVERGERNLSVLPSDLIADAK